jgi:hypothetical protein
MNLQTEKKGRGTEANYVSKAVSDVSMNHPNAHCVCGRSSLELTFHFYQGMGLNLGLVLGFNRSFYLHQIC